MAQRYRAGDVRLTAPLREPRRAGGPVCHDGNRKADTPRRDFPSLLGHYLLLLRCVERKTDVLDQELQVHRIAGRGFEVEVFVEAPGLVVDGVNE